ncbi:hypothetical protein A7979_10435 [Rothia nasimurium]|uniref:Molybdopterin molybdenumtransferase n=1 Tax=Rothia nasimurium TaxID=85336 RepID=A0A1Y1RRK1_9MICC|nr:hypothetical protein A7979_10435 [Rothia nasimurium]
MQHVSWQQAREILYRAGRENLTPHQKLPLSQALGRVLAEPLRTPQPVPHYDASAMDGYAVAGAPPWHLLEIPPATPEENVHSRVLPLEPGQAAPILTGGLLPPGADAVLRQEHALTNQGQGPASRILHPNPAFFPEQTGRPAAGADIRRAGEEVPRGAEVIAAGARVTARLAGALATMGFDEVAVHRRPTVAIAMTGNEIITGGLPGPGQVRDAYSHAFPALLADFGCQVIASNRLPDTAQALTDWLTGTDASLLLITGGSSTSTADWVRRVLAELNADYLFESVAVRPGHPALAARLPRAVNPASPIILGLPGNPLAAYTALYSYLPAWAYGATCRKLPELPTGVLTDTVPGHRKANLQLLPTQLDHRPQGPYLTPLPKTRSHMLTSFAIAQALALVPSGGAPAGAPVPYLPLS